MAAPLLGLCCPQLRSTSSSSSSTRPAPGSRAASGGACATGAPSLDGSACEPLPLPDGSLSSISRASAENTSGDTLWCRGVAAGSPGRFRTAGSQEHAEQRSGHQDAFLSSEFSPSPTFACARGFGGMSKKLPLVNSTSVEADGRSRRPVGALRSQRVSARTCAHCRTARTASTSDQHELHGRGRP